MRLTAASALPPDVRRGLCPPSMRLTYFGLGPSCGLCPIRLRGRARTQGRSPNLSRRLAAGQSPTAHIRRQSRSVRLSLLLKQYSANKLNHYPTLVSFGTTRQSGESLPQSAFVDCSQADALLW